MENKNYKNENSNIDNIIFEKNEENDDIQNIPIKEKKRKKKKRS